MNLSQPFYDQIWCIIDYFFNPLCWILNHILSNYATPLQGPHLILSSVKKKIWILLLLLIHHDVAAKTGTDWSLVQSCGTIIERLGLFDPRSAETNYPTKLFPETERWTPDREWRLVSTTSGTVEPDQGINKAIALQFSQVSHIRNSCDMFDIESMPDLLKPGGIVYSRNCFEQQSRPDENYQLIQDILVSKSPDLLCKSECLPSYHHEGMFEGSTSTSMIAVENMTPVTPPFSIEPVTADPYTSLHKVQYILVVL